MLAHNINSYKAVTVTRVNCGRARISDDLNVSNLTLDLIYCLEFFSVPK